MEVTNRGMYPAIACMTNRHASVTFQAVPGVQMVSYSYLGRGRGELEMQGSRYKLAGMVTDL